MFDLNKSILNWKKSLQSCDSFTRENIDELESHLNEQIADLTETGLNDEEAFWVAQKRIGTIQSLNSEYTKINNLNILKKKIYWILTGVAGLLMYSIFITSSYYFFLIIFKMLNFNPVYFIIINNSFNEIIIISVCLLILWILSSKNNELLNKYYFNKLNKINKTKLIIFIALTFVMSSIIYFYYTYELSTDVNRWISNSGSLNEFRELNKILIPLQFVFNSLIIFGVYYVSFVNKRKLEMSQQL